MPANKNDIRAMESLIAESEAHSEHLQRHLARMLYGQQSKQLSREAQTPQQLMVWWNDWAEKLGKPTITVVSKGRRAGFYARIASGQWDVSKMNERLRTLGRWALTSDVFTLDFFLCSEDNYAKFIEGNYSHDKVLKAIAESRAQEVDPARARSDSRRRIDDLLDRNTQ